MPVVHLINGGRWRLFGTPDVAVRISDGNQAFPERRT